MRRAKVAYFLYYFVEMIAQYLFSFIIKIFNYLLGYEF